MKFELKIGLIATEKNMLNILMAVPYMYDLG